MSRRESAIFQLRMKKYTATARKSEKDSISTRTTQAHICLTASRSPVTLVIRSGAEGAVKGHILMLELIEEMIPYAEQYLLGYVFIGHTVCVDYNGAQYGYADHKGEERKENVPMGGKVLRSIGTAKEFINDASGKIRDGELHGVVNHRAQHGTDIDTVAALHVLPQPCDLPGRIRFFDDFFLHLHLQAAASACMRSCGQHRIFGFCAVLQNKRGVDVNRIFSLLYS